MAFDVEGARQAGYSDAEIADHLAGAANFDAAAARKAGYGDAELIGHLASPPTTSAEPNPMLRTDPNQPNTAIAKSAPPFDPGALDRTVGAVREGWEGGSHPLTPAYEAAVDEGGPVGRYIVNPALRALTGVPAALFRGGQQAVMETANQIVPGTGRDLAAIPEAFAGTPQLMPHPQRLSPPQTAPSPRFVQEYYGEGLPTNRLAAEPQGPAPSFVPPDAARPPAVPINERPPGQPDVFVPPRPQEYRPGELNQTPPPRAPGTALVPVETTPPAPLAEAVTTPKTAAEAKAVASAYYDIADQHGASRLPANFANEFVDTVKRIAPQTEAGRVIVGETEVARLANRVEVLRDQPITLKAAQEIDEGIGNLIEKQFDPIKGLSKEGHELYELQTTFRDMVENAPSSSESAAGAAALKQGRAAWAQAQKMRDLERIVERASSMAQPSTGIITGIRTLLSNEKRSRGYTAAEKAALRQAQKRGVLGDVMHVFGSRLVPIAASTAAFAGSGLLGGLLTGGITHAGSTLLRNGATRLQSGRLQNAFTTIGAGVPPYPLPRNRLAPPE